MFVCIIGGGTDEDVMCVWIWRSVSEWEIYRMREREWMWLRKRECLHEREGGKGRREREREREKEGHNKENYVMMHNRPGEELDSASRELRKIEKRWNKDVMQSG